MAPLSLVLLTLPLVGSGECDYVCLHLTLKGLGGSPNSPNCQKVL
jgi:hypothetical protein